MPELPEVEVAARALRRWLAGERVVAARAEPSRVFRGSSRAAYERDLAGRALERVERFGKQLVLRFDAGVVLLSHLGMSGKWVRRAPGQAWPAHSRARLELASGDALHYADTRLFGRLAVIGDTPTREIPEIAALGPDPLRDGIDAGALLDHADARARPIKVMLMDQRVIAGIGNIQATEALFRAGVHPARPSRSISRDEMIAIAAGIEASIAHTLATLDAEEVAYLSESRAAPNPFLAYDRAGEACPRCDRALERCVIGGRSSVFCARCQPAEGRARAAPRRASARR